MKLIAILIILTTVFAYLYDERQGERRDGLPLPFFGGRFRVAAAQNVGKSIKPIVTPTMNVADGIADGIVDGIVDGAADDEITNDIENAMNSIDVDLAPADGVSKNALDLGKQNSDGSQLSRAMNAYNNLVDSGKQALDDLDFSPIENALKGLIELGHEAMDNVDFSAATDAFETAVKFGKQTVNDMIPQPKIAVIPAEQLDELEPVSPLATIENGFCPPVQDLETLLSKAKEILAVAFDIVLKFIKDLALWIEAESERIYDWTRENPTKAIVIGFAGTGIILMAAPGVVSGPVLQITGFGPNGVIAKSLAALVHSMIGNVAGGSTFAILQSAGAGGSGLAAVNGAIQGTGAVFTGYGVWDLLDKLVKEQI